MRERKKYLLEKAEEWINLCVKYHVENEELQVRALKALLDEYKKDEKIIQEMAEELQEHRYNNNLDMFNSREKANKYTLTKKEIIDYFRNKVGKNEKLIKNNFA